MLSLSRVGVTDRPRAWAAVGWTPIVVQVMTDVPVLTERRRIELGCDRPPAGMSPFPLHGGAVMIVVAELSAT